MNPAALGTLATGLAGYREVASHLPERPQDLGLSPAKKMPGKSNKDVKDKIKREPGTATSSSRPSGSSGQKHTDAKKKSYRTSNANRAASHIYSFSRPQHNSPMMMPSSSGTSCMAVTSQTVGLIEPNDTAPNGLPAAIFYPGSIKAPVYGSPTRAQGGNGIKEISHVGSGTTSQIWNDIQSIGAQYRVTAAHLTIHYIGNDDNNGGEFLVNKFKPALNVSQTPTQADWQNTDKFPNKYDDVSPTSVYLPAKKGVEVLFFRNSRQLFQEFSAINDDHAQQKMEGAVIWLANAATTEATRQKWRWTLTQTIELVFEADSFWSKFHLMPPCGRDEWDALYDRTMVKTEAAGADVTSFGAQAREYARQTYAAALEVHALFPNAAPWTAATVATALGYGQAYRQIANNAHNRR